MYASILIKPVNLGDSLKTAISFILFAVER